MTCDACNCMVPVEHELVLQLHPGTRLVEQAVLSPADVEVADLVEGARDERLGIHFVVRRETGLHHSRVCVRACMRVGFADWGRQKSGGSPGWYIHV